MPGNIVKVRISSFPRGLYVYKLVVGPLHGELSFSIKCQHRCVSGQKTVSRILGYFTPDGLYQFDAITHSVIQGEAPVRVGTVHCQEAALASMVEFIPDSVEKSTGQITWYSTTPPMHWFGYGALNSDHLKSAYKLHRVHDAVTQSTS